MALKRYNFLFYPLFHAHVLAIIPTIFLPSVSTMTYSDACFEFVVVLFVLEPKYSSFVHTSLYPGTIPIHTLLVIHSP